MMSEIDLLMRLSDTPKKPKQRRVLKSRARRNDVVFISFVKNESRTLLLMSALGSNSAKIAKIYDNIIDFVAQFTK